MKKLSWLYCFSAILLLVTLLAFPGSSNASEPSLEGYTDITAPELKQMIDDGDKILLINVLSEIEFNIQHITGSINIPVIDMLGTEQLPEDKNIPLVFHCLSNR